MMMKNRKADEREAIRTRFWAKEKAWTGENKKGWFRAPRTLPLVLELLRRKDLSGRTDPSSAYLALWARHFDGGVIEITNELDLAYDSGYTGARALRTWHERMALLERHGFIKSQKVANQKYRYVLLLDPAVVIDALAKQGRVEAELRATYDARRVQTGEQADKAAVVPLRPVRAAK
jgi:hypothetical protein